MEQDEWKITDNQIGRALSWMPDAKQEFLSECLRELLELRRAARVYHKAAKDVGFNFTGDELLMKYVSEQDGGN